MEIRTSEGDFSESFKMHIVAEVEAGRILPSEAPLGHFVQTVK